MEKEIRAKAAQIMNDKELSAASKNLKVLHLACIASDYGFKDLSKSLRNTALAFRAYYALSK